MAYVFLQWDLEGPRRDEVDCGDFIWTGPQLEQNGKEGVERTLESIEKSSAYRAASLSRRCYGDLIGI
jgi:hypothetical protein